MFGLWEDCRSQRGGKRMKELYLSFIGIFLCILIIIFYLWGIRIKGRNEKVESE